MISKPNNKSWRCLIIYNIHTCNKLNICSAKTSHLYSNDTSIFKNQIFLVVAPNYAVFFLNNVQLKNNFIQNMEISCCSKVFKLVNTIYYYCYPLVKWLGKLLVKVIGKNT